MLGELNPDQIRKTSILLGIPADFVRKDYFVTKAIQTLTNFEDDFFELIFQGGTSLSKGYQIIHRLSEDVDFRVIQKASANTLGKEVRRKKLRDYRYALVEALRNAAFYIPDDAIKVFYEGRFMSIQASFEDSNHISYLKPHVAIECFFGELALIPQKIEITSLVKQILGEECAHSFFPVSCVALDETAAEKWVALTRRVSGAQIQPRQSDKQLVRHIYDLYHLNNQGLLTGQYRDIVASIIEKDRVLYKTSNQDYLNDPLRASEIALTILSKNPEWRDHWNFFLEQMVYEKSKPSFDEAFLQLSQFSQTILSHVQTEPVTSD